MRQKLTANKLVSFGRFTNAQEYFEAALLFHVRPAQVVYLASRSPVYKYDNR